MKIVASCLIIAILLGAALACQETREPEESVRTLLKVRFLDWLKRFSEIENLRSLGYLK
jgi:hypothetical protein